MDIMVILQIIVLLGAIFVGVRLGGIGIGYAGGAGVLILGLCLGMKPGNIPWDVILIIASVISAISAMQLAGGLDYLRTSARAFRCLSLWSLLRSLLQLLRFPPLLFT